MRRRLRRIAIAIGIIGVLCVGYTAYQLNQVRNSLYDASAAFESMTSALSDGDTATARDHLFAAQSATMSARRNSSGPLWWIGNHAPFISDDVGAIQAVADVADNVAQEVAPALVEASTSLSAAGLQPKSGQIDLDGIRTATPNLIVADAGLTEAVSRVSALAPESLLSQLAQPIGEFEDRLRQARVMSQTAVRAARLLPPMLGADEKRTYLVMFQNNAELRATGGIPGAIAIVNADDGRLSLGRQGEAGTLGSYRRPVLPLTSDERELFTVRLGIYPADVTFTPDFPRAAQLAHEMWRLRTGNTLDGVISADPVALSYILGGTGQVDVAPRQTLTTDNAVALLLNQIYLDQPDEAKQNAYFARAARAVFDAVVDGQGDPRDVLDAIVQGADEHRILVWSHHRSEQALLTPTDLAGGLPTEASTTPQVGVYLNDGTGAKMDYYLDYEITVDSHSCSASGAQTLRLNVEMKSTAPPDAASLPVSVIGPGFGAKPGSIRTNVLIYAPTAGRITDSFIDGQALPSVSFTHDGRPVAAQTIDLAPGQSRQLTFTLISGAHQTAMPDVRVTPGVHGDGIAEVSASACS